MSKWEDLTAYKLLAPETLPAEFKKFAQQIQIGLSDKGFKLKQSKTDKQFYRVTGDLLHSIYINNTSAYAKNKKEIKISISIKPLFTEDYNSPYFLFDAYELNKEFKMYYVLSEHNALLAEHLLTKFDNLILPFFDSFQNSTMVCNNQSLLNNLLNHKKPVLQNLLYHCAFKSRNETIFYPLLKEKLEKATKQVEYWKRDEQNYVFHKLELDKLNESLRIFEKDDLFNLEQQHFISMQIHSLKVNKLK